jgi:predicted lipid-binding transport protein (Tim44 family)
MSRISVLLAGTAALMLALAPGLADARAGRGGSFGSRGSMTYTAPPTTRTAPYSAQPMQRSTTPTSPTQGYNSGHAAPSSGMRSGFMSGLMGGLIGAGIGGLLLGHGFFGGGLGFFGFLGFLLQILLLVLVLRFIIRRFRGTSPALAGGPNFFTRDSRPRPGPRSMSGGGASPPPPIGPSDFNTFEQMLRAVQAAWTAHDLNALRSMVTPEMLGYFAEQLSDQTSRGVRNEVRDVQLLSGDLSQAWSEHGRDYATVAMRFSMIDVTRDAQGNVVDGSTTEHFTATELWTFVRSGRNGTWILSAIQQAR